MYIRKLIMHTTILQGHSKKYLLVIANATKRGAVRDTIQMGIYL